MIQLASLCCRATVWTTLVAITAGALWRLPPEGVPKEAQPFHEPGNKEIEAWTHENKLYVDLKSLATKEKNEIRIARLSNVVKKLYWSNDPALKVQLQPEPDHWLIKLVERPKDPSTLIVMELDEPARAFDASGVSEPDSEGVVTLPAKRAITHGSLLRYEPQAHKNTVGYWANAEDTAEWHFEVAQSGTYEVDLLQGCGKGHGGSRVEIQLDGQKLPFEVQETGHFQNFIWRTLGTLNLRQTEKATLKLIPLHKAAGAVMDVRAIRLVPIGKKRSFDSELADPDSLPK